MPQKATILKQIQLTTEYYAVYVQMHCADTGVARASGWRVKHKPCAYGQNYDAGKCRFTKKSLVCRTCDKRSTRVRTKLNFMFNSNFTEFFIK